MTAVQVYLCFLMDCTGSMQAWIDLAKNHIQTIISGTRSEFPNTEFRVAFLGYRDYGDTRQHIAFPFTSNLDRLGRDIARVDAEGGHDEAEDVAGGLQMVVNAFHDVPANAVRKVIHIADAPAHGMQFHSPIVTDRYSRGDPVGLNPLLFIRGLSERGIDYTFVKINDSTDTMIEQFHTSWMGNSVFQVLDLRPQHPERPMFVEDDMIEEPRVPGGEPPVLRALTATVSDSIRHYTASQDW
jgi:hypothetical protein